MIRVDLRNGGALTVAQERERGPVPGWKPPEPPLVKLRVAGPRGGVQLFMLTDVEVLRLVRALLAGGDEGTAGEVAAEREVLQRFAGRAG